MVEVSEEDRLREQRALWRSVYVSGKRRGLADGVAQQDADEAVRRYKRRWPL